MSFFKELVLERESYRRRDHFKKALIRHVDELVAKMNRPGAAEATEKALFANVEDLNKAYRPGSTERCQDSS